MKIPTIIQHNVPLADKNWFRTGGNAVYFAEPTTSQEFQESLLFANQNKIPVEILGEGANILISDDGYPGLIIHPSLRKITVHQQFITTDAGASLPDVITTAFHHNLIGLEEFSGIPGSIGGAVYINVHYFEFLLSQFLHQAVVIDAQTGNLLTVDPTWFLFGYNQSKLHEKKQYLVSATFSLTPATSLETAFARGRHQEIIRHRARRYPAERTCGSFFRNFFPHEYLHAKGPAQVPYIAYYLDRLGFKGSLTCGGACVSHHHANMIVTTPGATSADVIAVARQMQQTVHKTFGIMPQPECQLLGFATNPFF